MHIKIGAVVVLCSFAAGCSYTPKQQAEIDRRREYRDHLREEALRAKEATAAAKQEQVQAQGEHELESKQAQLAELKRRKAEREMSETEQEHNHSQAMLDARRERAATEGQVEKELASAKSSRDDVKKQNSVLEQKLKSLDEEIEALLQQEAEHAKREEAKRKEQGGN